MSIIINLFGEGIRYWICDIPIQQFNEFEKIKKRNNLDWETMLFDFDFLTHFGYSHWSELSKNQEVKIFLLNHSNKLEIKERNKILLKKPSIDLLNKSSLFDLYSTEVIHFNFLMKRDFKSIVLIQNEIGLIAKYQIETSSFYIDKLNFQIVNNTKKVLDGILTNLHYENKRLKIISEDVLVRSMKVFII